MRLAQQSSGLHPREQPQERRAVGEMKHGVRINRERPIDGEVQSTGNVMRNSISRAASRCKPPRLRVLRQIERVPPMPAATGYGQQLLAYPRGFARLHSRNQCQCKPRNYSAADPWHDSFAGTVCNTYGNAQRQSDGHSRTSPSATPRI